MSRSNNSQTEDANLKRLSEELRLALSAAANPTDTFPSGSREKRPWEYDVRDGGTNGASHGAEPIFERTSLRTATAFAPTGCKDALRRVRNCSGWIRPIVDVDLKSYFELSTRPPLAWLAKDGDGRSWRDQELP